MIPKFLTRFGKSNALCAALLVLAPLTASAVSDMQGYGNLVSVWGGSGNSSNSSWSEGRYVPLRVTATGLVAGTTHTLVISYDFVGTSSALAQTQHFIDSVGSYNQQPTTANPTTGFPVTAGSTLDAPTTAPIPTDTGLPANAQRAGGVFTLYNVKNDATLIISPTYTLVTGRKSLAITFTVAGTVGQTRDVIIAYAGHLANERIWGVGKGASTFPGGSAKAYQSLDGGSDVSFALNPGVITVLSNVITFPQPPDRIWGDPDFSISASTTSNLQTTFNITSGAATATLLGTPTPSPSPSGTTQTVQLKVAGSVGPVTIQADQPGDLFDYPAASPVPRTFNVLQKNLTITGAVANTKVYNGNTTATVDFTNATLNGVVTGDSVTIDSSGYSATFSSASVGNGKSVTVTGVTLSGTNAGNYTVSQPTGLTADITGIVLTVTGITANNKIYDANILAALNTASAALVGVVPADAVGAGAITLNKAAAAGTFADKNVANGKTVTISGLTISGTNVANYTLTQPTATANITTKPASVVVAATGKVYGAAEPTLSGTLSGFIGSDNVTAGYSRASGETVAGSPYAISATLSPAGVLSNYAITNTPAAFNITAATLTRGVGGIDIHGYNKEYDAAAHGASGTATGVNGESLSALINFGASYTNVPGGSATWSFHDPAGNYKDDTDTVAITITAKPASVTVAAASKVYGAAEPTLGGTLSGFIASDNVSATYDRTAGETVAGGPYTISATLSPAGVLGNYDITNKTALFTINGKPASVTPDANSKIYGAAEPTLSGTLSGFLVGDNVSATYSRAAGETVAGGPYTISATLSPAGVLGNYDITYKTALFTINRATLTRGVGGIDVQGYSGEYDGAAHGATGTATGVNGESLNGLLHLGGSFTDVPGGTATWTFDGDSNYEPDTSTAAIVIKQKAASVTPDANSKIYGAAEPTLSGTLSGFLVGDNVSATYSRTAGETVAGGPYTITAVLSPAGVLGNYDITYKTAAFTINRATLTRGVGGIDVQGYSGEYDGAAHGATGTATGVNGESLNGLLHLGGSFTDVPGGTATWTFDGDSNYEPDTSTAAIVIKQKAASVTPGANSKIYGAAEPTLSGTLSGFLVGDNVTATYSRTAGETVAGGPYTISAVLSPAGVLGNYDITYKTAAFTINGKPASVTPDANSKTYGAAEPTLSGTLSGFLVGDNVSATYSRAAGETVAGGPYTISATLSPAGVLSNYDITYKTAAFTINGKPASVTPGANSKIYGAADPTLSGTLSGFLIGDNVSATYSRTAGETVAGGPYTISATLSPAGVLSNYDITYKTAAFTIKRATLTRGVGGIDVQGYSGEYDGAAHGATGTATGVNGESLNGLLHLGGSFTDVPGGTATWTFDGDSNYEADTSTVAIVIKQKAASVTPAANSKIYGAAEPSLTGTLSGFLVGDNVSATYSRTAGETVAGGPYTISATLSPTGVLGNYDITYKTAAFTIGKRSATWTTKNGGKTYGDADPNPLTTGSGDFVAGDGVSATYARVSGNAAGDYAITATLSATTVDALGNYTIANAGAKFTIGKKTASVTATAKSKSYGASDPVLNGTLTGFVASDTVTATYSRTAGETVGGSPYTITAVLSPTAVLTNYDIKNNSAEFTITRADIAKHITAIGGSFVFTGSSHPGSGSATGAKGEVLPTTLSYAGVSPTIYAATASAPTAVGTYNVTASTVGDANNLAASSAPAALTIMKASSTTTVTASDATYDGLPHGAIADVTGAGGLADPVTPITYSGRKGTVYNSTTPPTNAGDYTGGATFAGDANHTTSSGAKDFSIAKATLHAGPGGTIVINHYDVTYDGAPHTATGSVTGVQGEDLTNLLTLSGSTHTSIGTYATDPWSFAGNANYNSVKGTVTPADKIGGKTITVSAAGVDKVYDGTKNASVTLSTNKVGSDQVTASFTDASFADKHVGSAKPVNITGISISGADASNYTLANTTAMTTASITAKPITVTAVPDTKLYDGTTTSTGIPKVSPALLAGDKANFLQTFDSKVVGGKRTLTPSGSVTDGNAGKNYTVTFVSITVPGGGVITVRTVTGGIRAASKTYDRTTSATIAARTLTGVLSGDAVTLSGGTATFADPNAGTGKTVTATGLSLSGADADNYDLSSTTATAKADITKANQVINFAPIENKIFNVDGPFKIQATASSGLPVTLSLTSGPAKLDGTQVTITGVGKVTITASQAGDHNYNPAEMVQNFFSAVPPPALLNISTRGRVGTQDNVLIGGYIIRGVEEKKFAARGIGPSLKTKETPQVVVDPLLELHGPDGTLLAKNDNFAQTQLAEIQAAQLVPTNALESVVISGAMPGNYTAIVKDKREANGIGLVELYDLSQNSNSSLANLSTRGVVGAGPDVLIGGFIVNGKVGAAKVILRAIGPSLAEAGIANVLPNPTMELHDHNGALIGSDDNWQDDAAQAALIKGTGIPPNNPLESAFVTSLKPGNYTVIVADKDGKTGVGLVEIYDLTY